MTVTVVVVDNQRDVHAGMADLARRHPSAIELVGAHVAVEDLDLAAPPPDVVLLDLYLGRDDTSSIPWIPRLVEWGAKVLLHTNAEFPVPLRAAVAAGASGISLKNDDPSDQLRAVLDVAEDGFACTSALARALVTDSALVARLTPREVEVVQAIDDGLTQQQVGLRHDIGQATVQDHLRSVRVKYLALGRDVTNSHSIVREARRDGYIP